jgi:hypothetical protein
MMLMQAKEKDLVKFAPVTAADTTTVGIRLAQGGRYKNASTNVQYRKSRK